MPGVARAPSPRSTSTWPGLTGRDTISLESIFRGIGWFLACEVVIMVLIIAFPQISLFLPNSMN